MLGSRDDQLLDPISLEVIRHGLVSITDQIDANITRTAFSPFIYEYKDYAIGLVGPDGSMIAQNAGGMPIFVADSVGMAVRDGLATYGVARLRPGDVVLCNHPAVQGQHLNNTVMYTPIHAGADAGTLIGFFAINIHWIDIGGAISGATDIFMEGLQLRSIKLWCDGVPIEEVYRIIACNTRFPIELLGDIEAQLAGCLHGRDLTAALADRYGTAVFAACVARLLDDSEEAARAAIRAIPDGTYQHTAFLDDDGVRDVRVPITVKVVVAGDELTVDFSDMAEQVPGRLNSGYYGGGRTVARVAFKYLLGGGAPANEGTFRPLRLILPKGKLLNADATAPMGSYSQPFPTIIDCIIKALEPVLPERVTAGHYATFAGLRYYGTRTDGSRFDVRDGGFGGWGAGAFHDGGGPFKTMAHGDTRIVPVELQESLYPFRVEEVSLRQDSGGPGRFRGGLGLQRTYTILGPCRMDVKFDRIQCPPWGIAGGAAGRPGEVVVRKHRSAAVERLHKVTGFPLAAGDRVLMRAGGGGGYGPARERAPASLARDVRRGYVSIESAERDYGLDWSEADFSTPGVANETEKI